MNYREEAYLMHYGVPGMKWGKRAAKAVGTHIRESLKATGNQIIHPLRSSVARAELNRSSTLGQRFRQNQLYLKTSELKALNASVVRQRKETMTGTKFVDSAMTNFANAAFSRTVTAASVNVGMRLVRASLGG